MDLKTRMALRRDIKFSRHSDFAHPCRTAIVSVVLYKVAATPERRPGHEPLQHDFEDNRAPDVKMRTTHVREIQK